jgi:pseudouridine synthase
MPKRTKRLTSQGEEQDEIRINKFLSEAGVCSRREADRYIEDGKVKIDGEVARMGSKVTKNSQVTFCGKPVKKEEKLVLIAFNKPEGIVCTTDPNEPDNIIDYISYGMRIFPIGRLDKDSEGLILLTNDGNIVNKILRAENYHEKEYIVTVNKEITVEFIKKMSGGIPILDTVTNPCEVNQIDRFTFSIILTQGLNRQIRRMCEYCGYRVTNLRRIRIMNIQLGRLKPGDYRNVTETEIEGLNYQIKQRKSQTLNKVSHMNAKENQSRDKGNQGQDKENQSQDKENQGRNKRNQGQGKGSQDRAKENSTRDTGSQARYKGSKVRNTGNQTKDKRSQGRYRGNK